jgi:spectinomycin phosphotransferase
MKTLSARISERELAHALEEYWGLVSVQLSYLAVGFGDHHWKLVDPRGSCWFVTVVDLDGGWRGVDPVAGYADLRASMDTVTFLSQAGLEFALAPEPTTDGRSLAPLSGEHAITVFPFVNGAGGDSGDKLSKSDRLALIDVLARLHDGTSLARETAPIRTPDLAVRPRLEAALRDLKQPWAGGPYSEPARHLLAEHSSGIRTQLTCFDELVCETAGGGPIVLTHGEPHPGNILWVSGKPHLIDWDTVGLALPERDLWTMAEGGSDEANRYTELTGRRLSNDAMMMYRMRWSLDEIRLSLDEFRSPHKENEDTEEAWVVLTEEIEAIVQLAR